MTKILLMADAGVYNKDNICTYPTKMAGVYRISTELRNKGHECRVIDHIFSFSNDELRLVCQKYIKEDVDVLGFSSTFWFLDHFIKIDNFMLHGAKRRINNNAINIDQIINKHRNEYFIEKIGTIIDEARKINSKIKIIVGGTQAQIILNFFKFDAAFMGYAEEHLIKWISKENIEPDEFFNSTPIYKFKPHNNEFDFKRSQILYTADDFIDNDSFSLIEISRGCIFKCKFCSYPLNGRKKLDYIKDMDSLRDELMHNYTNFNITNYILSDDTFNDSTHKLSLMNDMLKTLPFKIKFTCYLRIDLLHQYPEQIQLLKEMGLVGAFFGVETFNHEAAKNVGKGLDPNKIKQLLYDLKKIHWGDQINVSIGMIVGLPYETEKSMIDFISWIENEEQCVIDCINPQTLFISSKKNKKDWLSDFEMNHETYGYEVDENNRWVNNQAEYFKNSDIADEWTNKIFQAALKRGMSHDNVSFGLIWAHEACKHAPNSIQFDEFISMSNREKQEWRHKNLYLANANIIQNYKNKVLSNR